MARLENQDAATWSFVEAYIPSLGWSVNPCRPTDSTHIHPLIAQWYPGIGNPQNPLRNASEDTVGLLFFGGDCSLERLATAFMNNPG